MSEPFNIRASGVTHVGMKRVKNQDSLLVNSELNLFIVADGMGGHRGGEVASEIAVTEIERFYLAMSAKPPEEIEASMRQSISAANEAIYSRGLLERVLQGMGTTTTAVKIVGDLAVIGHVGDSRCYFATPGCIWQLTRDHSLVAEKQRAGLITRAELKTDRMKNVITRSVGFEVSVNPDIYMFSPPAPSVLVICCDGVSNMLTDEQILAIVEPAISGTKSVENTAQELIDRSNELGSDDNVTAIVIGFQ